MAVQDPFPLRADPAAPSAIAEAIRKQFFQMRNKEPISLDDAILYMTMVARQYSAYGDEPEAEKWARNAQQTSDEVRSGKTPYLFGRRVVASTARIDLNRLLASLGIANPDTDSAVGDILPAVLDLKPPEGVNPGVWTERLKVEIERWRRSSDYIDYMPTLPVPVPPGTAQSVQRPSGESKGPEWDTRGRRVLKR